ncbi:hypothetical protein KSP40_PGU010019 [Platanthera guangdongensis]|uniref:Mitotic spindle checkpoint protein MAD1 n=1 Tax=Platanthera guangdongensis TaxID=2320717 RepID=A0ABR2MLC2_9ASPA
MMILRTPPQRKRRVESVPEQDRSPVSDRRIVPYVGPSDDFVCTYHCRQMVKSEVMVALKTAEKLNLEYKSSLEALSNRLSKCQQEHSKCAHHLCSVEQELQASKGRESALQEQLLKETSEHQERFYEQLKRCSELEVQMQKEVEFRRQAELSADAAKEKSSAVEKELLIISENSEREKNRLQLSFSHSQDESKLLFSRVNAELDRKRIQADNFAKEAELLRKSLLDLKEQLKECLHEKSQLEYKLLSCDSPLVKANPSDNQTLVKHLRDELRKAETELHEARQLKSSHTNKEFLTEQLLEEKGRREKVEMELTRFQEVQLHAQRLESELTSWKSLLKQIPDVSCYDDIPKKIAHLQKEIVENMLKVGEGNARLKELQVALEMSNLSKEHTEKECKLAKEETECTSMEVKRLELMLLSVSGECERLKKDAVNWSKQKSGLPGSGQTNETDLETLLEQKEHAIRELGRNLCQQRESINRQHDEIKALNENFRIESKNVKSLERENDRLRSENSLLELKLGHGDYSVENTKVLRMVNTLGINNEAKHTIETLQIELQKAKSKLQAIEELREYSGEVINTGIPEKLLQLKGQIAVLEKREERYKAVFAEKISVFRRACCSLFGYKIVMDDRQRPNGIPVTRFTLQSIYAQNDDEKLEFDYESGSATILVNEYTSQQEIQHQVEIFIRKMNSIPAFTANLTVESFNSRTLS